MKYDLNYISNYILEYNTEVPIVVIWGVLAIMCGIIIVQYLISNSIVMFVRNAALFLLVGYIFLIICGTILFRDTADAMRYALCPFNSYMVLYDKLLAQLILNVAMFIPIGFFAGATSKIRHIWKAVEVGFALSLFIELTQLVTMRGVFNVDDIIHNTLGCIIGFACFVLCNRMARRIA